jgi:hypothetical protein
LEEQTTLTVEVNIQRVVLLALAILAVAIATLSGTYYLHHADPYVQDVLALQGEQHRGTVLDATEP